MIKNKELIPEVLKQTQKITQAVNELFVKNPVEQLRHRPPNSNWNALDCIDHLNRTYDWYLPLIKEALQKTPPPEKIPLGYHPGYIGKKMTEGSQPNRGEIRFKMKTFKRFEPHTDQLETEYILANFRNNQAALEQYVQESASYHLGKTRITSAVGPILRFKLGDCFQFLLAHNERHLLQGQRLLATPRKQVI